MSYLDLLDEEGENAQFLCVLKPARRVTDWVLYNGSVYLNDFDFGYVVGIKLNGVSLTPGSSATLSAGEYYYDHEAMELFLRKSDSTAPDASDFIVVTYELHFGTFDAHFHRTPTDDTTTTVYFDPVIAASPDLKNSVSDLLFGFLPTSSTSIGLINAEHILEKHFYDSSFFDKEISIFHWIGDLEVGNIKEVFRGRMGNHTYLSGRASIQIFDTTNAFQKEFRSLGDVQFYNLDDFPGLNPELIGAPIRTVFGRVDGFIPTNIDFVQELPTTSDNRDWITRSEGVNSHALVSTVPASPVSTATRTYLAAVSGWTIGDTFKADKTTDEYGIITAVGANYVEHGAFASGACSTGDTLARGTVSKIEIVQAGIKYIALYARDYTESTHASGALQFTFSSSLESNLSMPETLSAADLVYCRVYGKKNNVTLGGSPFGGNSATYGNLTDIVVILFDILKNFGGISESELDLASFTALQLSAGDEIGFVIPAKARDPYTTIKDAMLRIFKSGLIKIFPNFDLEWEVSQMAPLDVATKTISDDEILRGSISYEFDYSDLYSDFIVNYGYQETTLDQNEKSLRVSQSSDYAKFVHGQSKTFEHESLHIDEAGAQSLADRLSYALGDRQGNYNLETKNRFFDNVSSDVVEVSSEKMPGFAFDSEVENSRSFAITQIEKSLRKVKLRLNDQKGIEDNSGSW